MYFLLHYSFIYVLYPGKSLYFIFYNIHTFIQSCSCNTFFHRHSLRPLSISLSLVRSVRNTSLWCQAENRTRASGKSLYYMKLWLIHESSFANRYFIQIYIGIMYFCCGCICWRSYLLMPFIEGLNHNSCPSFFLHSLISDINENFADFILLLEACSNFQIAAYDMYR